MGRRRSFCGRVRGLPAAAAAAAVAAATPAAAAVFARPRLVDGEAAARQVAPVHRVDGGVHLVVLDLDEAEALGAARVAVGRNGRTAATPLGEGVLEVRLGSV